MIDQEEDQLIIPEPIRNLLYHGDIKHVRLPGVPDRQDLPADGVGKLPNKDSALIFTEGNSQHAAGIPVHMDRDKPEFDCPLKV